MDPTALYYAFSTIAQCAAALAALIGFFGLWTVERLRQEEDQAERELREFFHDDPTPHPEGPFFSSRQGLLAAVRFRLDLPESSSPRDSSPRDWSQMDSSLLDRYLRDTLERLVEALETLTDQRQQLMDVLVIFLLGTLAILVITIGLIPFADALYTWVWTMRVVSILAGLWLGGAPVYVIVQAAGGHQAMRQHWARWAAQLQRRWTRARTWRGPAQIITRLRASLTAMCDRRRRH
jgi:hypothetical protein